LSLLALAKQLDDNPAELRTDENRWLLVQAVRCYRSLHRCRKELRDIGDVVTTQAELYIGHSADHAKYWDDAIKLNYARVLRRFTGTFCSANVAATKKRRANSNQWFVRVSGVGAAQLLVAAQATGGDIANPNVPFPGSPPKP